MSARDLPACFFSYLGSSCIAETLVNKAWEKFQRIENVELVQCLTPGTLCAVVRVWPRGDAEPRDA